MKITTDHKMRMKPGVYLGVFVLCLLLGSLFLNPMRARAVSDATPRSLQGEAAVRYLKEQGLYYSLQDLNTSFTQEGVEPASPPPFVEQQKLTASDGAEDDRFGFSIVIQGTTLVVGAARHNIDGNENQGAVYVFEHQGGTWVEQQKLTASDGGAGDAFGLPVAISGETIVIGATLDDVDGNIDQGSAYVFERQGGLWIEQQKLTSSDGAAEDRFGFSVAIDGSTIIVGAALDDIDGNTNQGSAYVFVRQGGTWIEQQKLTASDGAAGDRFSTYGAVAIDDSRLVVGAGFADIGGNTDQGAAYVFVHRGGTWFEQQKLTASDGAADDQLGRAAVAINRATIVVGAATDEITSNIWQGSAYVFEREGGTWVEQQKLTASDGAASDFFGYLISMDSSTLVIAAFQDDIDANVNQGSAYVFERQGGMWVEQQKLTASDGAAFDNFGLGVAIDGSTIVVGAWLDDIESNPDQGSVYVFTRER